MIIWCILFLINYNYNFKIIFLSINSIKYFIFYFRNIFFQFILFNQNEFSIFLLFFLIIFLFNHNSLFLSLVDFNIWFKRFIFSKLLEEKLLLIIIKYFIFLLKKNIYIIYNFHYNLFDILNNLIINNINNFDKLIFITFINI